MEFQIGQEFKGKIKKIIDAGAFIPLTEKKDGFLHISQVRPGERISNIKEHLEEGQEISVRISYIDDSTGRIKLARTDINE